MDAPLDSRPAGHDAGRPVRRESSPASQAAIISAEGLRAPEAVAANHPGSNAPAKADTP